MVGKTEMTPVYFDANTMRPTEYEMRGVAGFISWQRLFDALRHSGEFKPTEEVGQFKLDERGITYYVSTIPR